MATDKEEALSIFKKWYKKLPKYKGGPARGSIAASLVVLERLKEKYNLDLDSHRALGKSQISGASGGAVAKILERFGEARPFLSEGGRTNRGAPRDVGNMLDALKTLELDKIRDVRRAEILELFQGFLVEKVREYHNRQRLNLVYDESQSAWQSIHNLLEVARSTGKEGPVAQYLIGAKLQLRFSDIDVSNESFSTADVQLDRPGDFYIGDTAFHVTVSPMPGLYEKCHRNINDGLRVYLLVPERRLEGARQNADIIVPGKIAVECIESFVAQNIDEISRFSKSQFISSFRQLLDKYNERVDAAENDKSLLIEIPRNLRE